MRSIIIHIGNNYERKKKQNKVGDACPQESSCVVTRYLVHFRAPPGEFLVYMLGLRVHVARQFSYILPTELGSNKRLWIV